MSDRSVIVIDGSSAMSDEVQGEFHFRLLPIHVLFGDEDFTPGVNMTTAEYYEKLESSKKPPTTAAPSLGECVEIYRALVAEGFRSILVITVINEASVTHTVAKTAAQQVDGAKIEVVDSRTTAGGITLIATACARILRDGRVRCAPFYQAHRRGEGRRPRPCRQGPHPRARRGTPQAAHRGAGSSRLSDPRLLHAHQQPRARSRPRRMGPGAIPLRGVLDGRSGQIGR